MRRRRTDEERLAEEEDELQVSIEPVSRLPTYITIHKILTNPFYAGKVLGNGGQYVPSASHEAIVSEELFNRVQLELARKKRSAHYLTVLDLPLRGLVRCGLCRRLYTPYRRKGILYYGSRCAAGCSNTFRNCNFDFIAGRALQQIGSLFFTDDELAQIDESTKTETALREGKRLERLDEDERKKKKIREDLAYLDANRLTLLKTGAYTPEGIVVEEAKLRRELSMLEEREHSDADVRETVKYAVRLSELLKSLCLYCSNGKSEEKEEIIRTTFSELTITENVVDYQCQTGFQFLAARFVPMCDLTTWFSELIMHKNEIAEAIRRVEAILGSNP